MAVWSGELEHSLLEWHVTSRKIYGKFLSTSAPLDFPFNGIPIHFNEYLLKVSEIPLKFLVSIGIPFIFDENLLNFIWTQMIFSGIPLEI
jgi:hypothetical protein